MIARLNRLYRWPVGKPHIVTALTDRKRSSEVLEAIVCKQAISVNAHGGRTVMSVGQQFIAPLPTGGTIAYFDWLGVPRLS